MKVDLKRLKSDRSAQVISLLGLVLIVYAWTVSRDLLALSERMAATEYSSGAEGAVAITAPQISFEAFDTGSVLWFGAPSEEPKDIVISRHAAPEIQAPVEPPPAPPEPVVEPFPAMKLSGIFLGDRVQEALVDAEGQKRRVQIGQEVNGWRLSELERNSAVFESPSGQRESLKLFPGIP